MHLFKKIQRPESRACKHRPIIIQTWPSGLSKKPCKENIEEATEESFGEAFEVDIGEVIKS